MTVFGKKKKNDMNNQNTEFVKSGDYLRTLLGSATLGL